MSEHLRDHVGLEPDPARMERQWSAIRDRVGDGPPRRSLWPRTFAAASALVVAAALVYIVWPGEPTPAAFSGASLESNRDEVRVTLADGSRVALAPESRLDVESRAADAVELRVRRGSASFEVPHVERRAFSVRAHDVEVVVVGTAFDVAIEGRSANEGRVEVSVRRGVVEIRRPGVAPISVRAGQRWETSTRTELAGVAEGGSGEPLDEGSEPEAAPDVEPSRPERSRPSPRATSEAMWTAANEARRSGDPRAAANAYERFLRAAPRDRRAHIAAFELGRLRMDRLGDMRGATQALRRSLSLAPRSPFAEDIHARLVTAAARLGNVDQCRRARARYLARFPGGVHRAEVEQRCPE